MTDPRRIKFIEQNKGYLFNVAKACIRQHGFSEVEDVVNQSVVEILRNKQLDMGRPHNSVLGYASLIVRDTARTMIKKRYFGLTEPESKGRLPILEVYPDFSLSPERIIQRVQTEEGQDSALEALEEAKDIFTEPQRLCLIAQLRDLDHLETGDLFEAAGYSIGTAAISFNRVNMRKTVHSLFDPETYEVIPVVDDLMELEFADVKRYYDELLSEETEIDLEKIPHARKVWRLPNYKERKMAYKKGREGPFHVDVMDPLYVKARKFIDTGGRL